MKINYKKMMVLFSIAGAALPLLAGTPELAQPTQDFPNAVQFELGDGEFPPGDSITIQSIIGTSDTIQPGGTYCVAGTYVLESQDSADLSFFATTTNAAPTPIDPAQTMRVTRGTGSFRLIKKMNEDGYLHVTFYSRKNGQGFGGVYFGQGQWVLHDKQFHYAGATSQNVETPAQPAAAGSDANEALYAYLGEPVTAPATIDAAYTKDGLIRAMQTASQNAGISLLKLEIDDSEFPFLVGVVFANQGDKEKLKEQIGKMSGYATSGGVGGEISYAMNIVPYTAFPKNAGQRIYRRMTVRESILCDRITGSN